MQMWQEWQKTSEAALGRMERRVSALEGELAERKRLEERVEALEAALAGS
jgi:hypothetical protein